MGLKLIDGDIPAFTKCPFRDDCNVECGHQGIAHPRPFSCALARGLDMTSESKSSESEPEVDSEFVVNIKLGNPAMSSNDDLAAALAVIARKLRQGTTSGAVMDANGNRVGFFKREDD